MMIRARGGVGKLRPAGRGNLCGPQGSHTHIDCTYFESMLKSFYRLD